jgi:tellurite resistance protein TerC
MFGPEGVLPWIGFVAFVILLVVIDLGLFSKGAQIISLREAAVMSAIWIGVAIAFGIFVWVWLGSRAGIEYFTGWLLEKSLSVDNLFVFVVIFGFFGVAPQYQRRVLAWGIIGALVMRAVFIMLANELTKFGKFDLNIGGTAIHFSAVFLLFGLFLIYTAWRMIQEDDSEGTEDLNQRPIVKLVRRFLPMTDKYHGERFSIVESGKRLFTPLVLVLAMIETTDLIFAVDSIPAILGVTQDPFIVFTSNIMAILGLRALYFLLAGILDRFHLLKYALSAILAFVGVKMIIDEPVLHGLLHIEKQTVAIGTLLFVLIALTIGIVASLRSTPHASSEKPH